MGDDEERLKCTTVHKQYIGMKMRLLCIAANINMPYCYKTGNCGLAV